MKNQKKVVLLLLLTILHNSSFTQDIGFSINGGLNITNTTYEINDNGNIYIGRDNDNRLSYFFGADIYIPVTIFKELKSELSVGIQYSQQGDSFDFDGRQTNIINQINLPVLLNFRLFRNFKIGLGGYLGYLVSVEEYFRESEENYARLDSGLVFSIKYNLIGNLDLNIQYLLGLKDVLNREFNNKTITHNVFNKVFQLGLIYKL